MYCKANILLHYFTKKYSFDKFYRSSLLVASGVAFVVHLMITYANKNSAFEHVINASSSSWLQEHVSDLSERWVNIRFLTVNGLYDYVKPQGVMRYCCRKHASCILTHSIFITIIFTVNTFVLLWYMFTITSYNMCGLQPQGRNDYV